jgi:hypothetical protein
MIGVSRRQAWTRRGDGSEKVASYRYYQCESRTNQGICSYHTRRADELEEALKRKLEELDPKQLAVAGDDSAVIVHWQEETQRLQDRLQQIDRRFSRALEEAATEKLSREKLRAQGLAVAEERLKVEEELRDAQWRAENYSSAAERRRTRNAALELAISRWDSLALDDKKQLLQELIDHVKVDDDDINVVLRP